MIAPYQSDSDLTLESIGIVLSRWRDVAELDGPSARVRFGSRGCCGGGCCQRLQARHDQHGALHQHPQSEPTSDSARDQEPRPVQEHLEGLRG